ncbi:MAG TPA: flagellar M-ring protein FliF C-terminal domain-containing protein [Candidatus Acidoferrales bacterium]|jgi:flagellar biosynthesis/type III secretory pathway M-ring protein FliF/YscJ|nr:flagellar M-ring protein FliF C-terminal domain-containing protein [Candidatus Acidoferrales bacterium]
MPQLLALLARWNALPARVRLASACAFGTLAVVAIVGGILAHPAQTPLFPAPLHSEQLLEVQEQLANWSVPFTPLGDNVVVDAGRRSDLLLRLSLAGIPHAHLETSGEALAGVGALTPPAVIDAQTRAGLAGDIEAGLRGVTGVDDARAIVVPAVAAEFGDQRAREASASVRLRLRPGARLTRPTVAGIRAYVAASVGGLDPAHVLLLDDDGVALGTDDAGDAANLERELQGALDAAFGEGGSIVRVRAEYRNATVAEHTERRVPLPGAAIERTDAGESFDGDGKHYRRDDQHEDRGSESRDVLTQTPPGTLVRISTAVFVDRSRAAQLPAIRELAAATVGFDPKRGDSLAVAAVDFSAAPETRKDAWWLLYGAVVPLLPALALATGAILAIRAGVPPVVALARGYLERASVERTSKHVAGCEPARVRSALAQEPPHAAAAIISALPAATAAAVLELYPAHERDAIVRRMQRPHSPLIPDAEEVVRRHA